MIDCTSSSACKYPKCHMVKSILKHHKSCERKGCGLPSPTSTAGLQHAPAVRSVA